MARNRGVRAPSGVTVTRKNNKYTVTWKRGTNYTAQSLYYQINDGEKINVEVDANATSKAITIDMSNYYPKTDVKITKLIFSIKGGTGKANKRKWSAETTKQYSMVKPPKPQQLKANLSSENENTTDFVWTIDWGDIDKAESTTVFTNYHWWSSLLKDSELEPNKVTTWQESGVTEDYMDDEENSHKEISETQVFQDNYAYTRYFKVSASGPVGDSDPVYEKHVYAFPNTPKNVKATAVRLSNGAGYRVSVQWTVDETKARPIDSVSFEYAIETPASSYTDANGVRKVILSVPPTISQWTAVGSYKDTTDKNGDVDGAAFVINGNIPADKCIFIRVVAKHDKKESPSDTVFVTNGYGALTAPASLTISKIENNIATLKVTNGSAVTASFVGIYYRSDATPTPKLVGIWPAGNAANISVAFPNETTANNISFGARTFVANYSPVTAAGSGVTQYATSNILMQSDGIVWDNRSVPKPPSNITLSSPRTGVVRVTWDWTWTDANGVELSWADHDDAWESTDAPSTHVLEDTRASAWNVAGLDVGVWYFRIRLFKTDGDATTYGTYSDIKQIKLASSPATPVLTVSPSIVEPDGKVTCYWAFTATEGDEQVQADICEATLNASGEVTYGRIVAKANGEQFKTLSVKDLGWIAGNEQPYYLAVRIITASGEESDNWSVPKPVRILNPITARITSTSLTTITVSGESQLALTSMPLTVSASGAGEDGVMTYILERADNYHVDRPDETDLTGFKGETVAIIRKSAEKNGNNPATYDISIDQSDLIGTLDDGAPYNLIAIAEDSYGQVSSPVVKPFQVHWAHQAVMPSATIEVDEDELAVYITPIIPSSGYASGDTCDIYRLSIDAPELIVEGAAFGTKYVDPYPALGNMGGHRVVYKTINGDYITDDNEFAWVDYDYEEGDIINTFATIIDYGDDQIILPYDLSLSNKWSKDFTQTKYLGGSVEGDWNPAIERTSTVNTRVSVQDDPELLESMRRLATYAGICHVRTPDGSSFAANVNVNEDREERKINMVASFSLDITRVDSAGFDGMTYAEWVKGDE